MLRIRRFIERDEETYVRVHNEGYSTEKWFGTLAKPATREEVSELSYDVTFVAEVGGRSLCGRKKGGDVYPVCPVQGMQTAV